MNRLIMIWGVLLLAGTVQSTTSKASESSSSTINMSSTSHMSSSTTHSTPHVTSNTTTHSTPHTTSNTTHTPSNTTSHAPTNTTTHPTTAHTTSPILPTKPSPPIRREYKVKDANNVTCIIADMGLALELDNSTTVMQDKDAKVKWYFNVNPETTTANGTCNESTATLILTFPQGSIHFVFVKDKKIYYIDDVSVNFTWNSAEHWIGTARNLKLLSTDVGYATKCKTTPTVKLASNLSLSMADVKLQAFNLTDGVFGKEEVCSYDRNMIAVAVAVTILIIIIIAIVIFFICHKRRSSGYQRI
ncbi:lysosome-associated membrane glycoprotein 3 isoform X2 [Rana temporaria]|uniref:lysosome-associated membrane glycoprotein 3 isoform X2 n=1 Tax=Rana temporaria TaxID=8407 RepID=UPI001AADF2C6|nr:lysosome-associated membrane glycoprotein 3 isoform X2 [Rana temporaria]